MREEFVHFPQTEDELPFYIQLAGTSYCDGSYKIYRRKSVCMVTEYVVSGEGTVTLDGKQYRAKEGDIYMLPPGRDHYYYSDSANPWVKVWFNACGALIDGLFKAYDPKYMAVFPAAGGREFIDRILEIGRDDNNNAKEKHEKAAIVFHELMQFLHGKYYTREKNYSRETVLMKEYMDNHVAENITLKELGDMVYLSESQIIRIFKKDLGTTPYEYILSLKMEQAKLMLRSTGLMVKEIAFQLGFCDEHYFTYLFKQRTGKTPTAYRKESRGFSL